MESAHDHPLHTAELGGLLAGIARAVVQAQDGLDAHAAALAARYVNTPDGTVAIPPLWYTVNEATVELEMTATLDERELLCRLVDPRAVALYGYRAAAGTRVRLAIGLNRVIGPKLECDGTDR